MRKKKHRDARIAARADLLFLSGSDSSEIDLRHGFLDTCVPVFLEIGCGKGGFICELAGREPVLNFVAMERNLDVLVLAMEQAYNLGLGNVRFLMGEAERLADYFAPGQIAGIYLNFSDPWHKNRQAHKRLTHKYFLEIYKRVLRPGASIIMKTDNTNLFDFSLRSFAANGFKIISCTRDLYSSEFLAGNVATEYERKFVSDGVNICRLEAGL